MKNLIAQSQIQLQILGSYAHIYLRLIPQFYLQQYRKCYGSLIECIITSVFMFFALFAIVMFVIMYITKGVHYNY